jgi:hypothetical protein
MVVLDARPLNCPNPVHRAESAPGRAPFLSGESTSSIGSDRPATHGDLLRIATTHITAAQGILAADPAPDRHGARAELLAYRELLHALRVHAQHLLGTNRAETIRRVVSPHPADFAALHLIDTLAAAVHRRPCPLGGHTTPPPGTVADHWLLAARSVRAAGDLLASHRDTTTGGWRSPDSHHLDERPVRSEGIRRIAELVAIVAGDEPTLRTRCRRSGMTWSDVRKPLPDLIAVRATASEVLAVPVDAVADALFDALTVARPNMRRQDPLDELLDRLAHLRQNAWELQDAENVSIDTLTAIAVAAITWHRATVPRKTSQARSDQATGGLDGTTARSLHPLAAWRAVRAYLGQLATLAAADLDADGDARALVGLLHRFAWPDAVITATQSDDGRPFLTDDTLSRGGRVFAQVAACNRSTVENLAASDQLWMPARLLTGAEVTDHPDLAAAKLRRGHVHVGPDRLDRLLAAYQRATTP